MTKIVSTKRALFTSLMALALCFAMLTGTTFAWFTDQETSAGNIIIAGNLDVEMYWADGTADPDADSTVWTDASTGAIFNYDKWEPGYVQVRHIKIANEGTLALKYKVSIIPTGEVTELADVIDVYYLDPAQQIADRAAIPATKLGTLTEVLAALGETGEGTLEPEKCDTITIAFKMQESAGNEYQDKSIGSDFSVQLIATQLANESDSFDNQYDVGAPYLENVSASAQIPDNAEDPLVLTASALEVEVPEEILNALSNEVTSISLGYSTPKMDEQNKTITFDSIEFVDQNGKEIDIATLNLTENIKITLPVANVFNNGDEVALYHDGETVATATVVDGYVTYEAAHFCEVAVIKYDYVVTDLEGLIEAFANGGDVLLFNDIKFEKLVSVLPGAKVNLDMNGKTITVNQNTESNTLIWIQDGAELIVDGNGTFDLEGVSTMSIFAPWGKLVIENGTFIRDEVTTVTDKTTGLFNGSKSLGSDVTINGGYFDAGYYNKNADGIEAILAGQATLTETDADVAKRGNSGDANVVRTALKENISVLLNHSGYGTFKVYGGTFVGANPAWGDEGCMLPTTPDYLRPWSYYQGALIDGQTFNEEGIVLPAGYTIALVVNNEGIPTYTVAYNK